MRTSLVAVGDNCLDVYLAENCFTVGGNALNVAADWRALGLDARYIGAVGDDAPAALLLDGVERAGLDTGDVRRLSGLTGVTFIRLNDSDRELLHEEFGVGLDLRLSDAEVHELSRSAWVHVQGTSPRARIVERLVAAGASVSVDLSTYHVLDGIDGVHVAFASSDDDDPSVALALAESIRAAGARLAVVMRGEKGSLALDDDGVHARVAEPIDPVDTCGAGDSYIAGFTAALAAGAPVDTAMERATVNAAATCLHFGGWRQPVIEAPSWLHERAASVGVTI